MSLIKDVCVQHQASLCRKLRFQGWRCHLVNLGDFNTHPFMHTQLPTPHLLRRGKGKVVQSGWAVTSIPCHVPRVPSGGTP